METGVVLKDCYGIDQYFKKYTPLPFLLGYLGLEKNYPINAKKCDKPILSGCSVKRD